MGKKSLTIAIIIFIVGILYFNSQVSDACSHGNCIHGWDSKYTQDEQRNYFLWFFGFPAAVFLLYKFFIVKKRNSHINQKNSSQSGKVKFLKFNPQTKKFEDYEIKFGKHTQDPK